LAHLLIFGLLLNKTSAKKKLVAEQKAELLLFTNKKAVNFS